MTLTGSSFQPAGTAASPDLRGSLHLQEMTIRFANGTYTDASNTVQPVTQDMVTNLQSTINGSPVLATEMKRAVTTLDSDDPKHQHRLLENFAPLSGMVAGGTYSGDSKTMSVPPASLAWPPATFQQIGMVDLTFVLGHETQHAFNRHDKMVAYRAFDTAARAIATDNDPINDYTGPVGQLIAAGRDDEAKVQLAGWNALLSAKQQTTPHANLTDMLKLNNGRMNDFVEIDPRNPLQARARFGMTFDLHTSMVSTTLASNIETQGQYYFDKPPKGTPGVAPQQTTGLGFHGDSDYQNYYGAGAVSRAIYIERKFAHPVHGVAPQMQFDMAHLRLREDLLEHNGITLPSNIGTPQPYTDIGVHPPRAGLFQHTATTHLHTSPIPPFPLEASPVSSTPSASRGRAEEADGPDHPLPEKIKGCVRELEAGNPWDDRSERISASLLTLAVENRFSARDDLKVAFNTATPEFAAGTLLHLFRAGHPNPAESRADMTTSDALWPRPRSATGRSGRSGRRRRNPCRRNSRHRCAARTIPGRPGRRCRGERAHQACRRPAQLHPDALRSGDRCGDQSARVVLAAQRP